MKNKNKKSSNTEMNNESMEINISHAEFSYIYWKRLGIQKNHKYPPT